MGLGGKPGGAFNCDSNGPHATLMYAGYHAQRTLCVRPVGARAWRRSRNTRQHRRGLFGPTRPPCGVCWG